MEMNSNALSDENIRWLFRDAADFVVRELVIKEQKIYVYMLDGLTSGSAIAETVIKPLVELAEAGGVEQLYEKCLNGLIYNAVAKPCEDLKEAAFQIVNAFCVVLFPGVGGIGFEVRSGQRRTPSNPDSCSIISKLGLISIMLYNT